MKALASSSQEGHVGEFERDLDSEGGAQPAGKRDENPGALGRVEDVRLAVEMLGTPWDEADLIGLGFLFAGAAADSASGTAKGNQCRESD